jgi:hypothetical protein
MDNQTATKAAKIMGVFLALIVVSVYLAPWLLPLFYDMPDRTTAPYYALLLAIEMAPHAQIYKRDVINRVE